MKTYAAVYLSCLLLTLVLTPVVTRMAHFIGLHDRSGARKVHTGAIPRIGGIAIALPMLVMTIAVLLLSNTVGAAFQDIRAEVVALLCAATFVFLVGLLDDIRGLRARTKLLAQILAALAVVAAGIRIETINLTNSLQVDFGWIGVPVTLLWIVGITNAVNLIDGLDGLAAGIASITCALIATFALYNEQPVMAVLMLALLGSLNAFLVFNFNPAKIFMGDSGSLFLGFVLATASVLSPHKAATVVGLGLPMLALGVPIFDTVFSMLRRILGRRSVFSADQDHIHHKLMQRGLNHRNAVLVMYGVTLAAAALAAMMIIAKDANAIILFVIGLGVLLLIFRLAGVVHVRDSLASLRRNRAIAREIRGEQRVFEQAQLALQKAQNLDEWWAGLASAARGLRVRSMALTLPDVDGRVRTLSRHDAPATEGCDAPMTVRMPVRYDRGDGAHHFEAEVDVNGSLESGNRRVALIGRLIDENGPDAYLSTTRGVMPSNPKRASGALKALPAPLSVMQFPVVPFESCDHAVDCIAELIDRREKNFCVAANPEKVYRAETDSQLREALRKTNLAICDGIGIVLAARILYGRSISRVTGVDLFLALVERAAIEGWSVFLLGASEEANSKAARALAERHPDLKIAGRCNGYFEDSRAVVDEINASGADLLFVALGSPKQEFWIAANRERLAPPFCMGVGGTYDVVSGRTKRAHRFWQAMGLEFLYRLLREPRRWRRQISLPMFLVTLFRQRIQNMRAASTPR